MTSSQPVIGSKQGVWCVINEMGKSLDVVFFKEKIRFICFNDVEIYNEKQAIQFV